MSGADFPSILQDARIAPHAVALAPAWLWSTDGRTIIWANAVGAAIFDAADCRALTARSFDPNDLAPGQIARLAATLPLGGTPRLERLRGFGARFGQALLCNCARIALADRTAILVVATSPAGPSLPLAERVRRLQAGADNAAAFTPDGVLIDAGAEAAAALAGHRTLADIGAADALAQLRDSAPAIVKSGIGDISLLRVGTGASAVVLARFPAHATGPMVDVEPIARAMQSIAQEQIATPEMTALPAETAPETGTPAARAEKEAERRHPLRFVWQMDAEHRFTIDSSEFEEIIGASTAGRLGVPWPELASALALDPAGEVMRALASRNTFSGINLAWPVDGTDQRLNVEFSGLPVFDRERNFLGFRGFGVCRDMEAIAQIRAKRSVPTPPRAAPGEAPEQRPAVTVIPPVPNVVPFRAANANAALSPVERSAFSELAQRLTARIKGEELEKPATATKDIARESQPAPPLELDEMLFVVQPEHTQTTAVAAPIVAAATPTPEAAVVAPAAGDAKQDDQRPVLDRLPLGILIYRHDQFLFANAAFLSWTGYASLTDFAEAGGLETLFIENRAGDDGVQSLSIERADGEQRRTDARLFTIPWDDANAMVLVLLPGPQAVTQAAPQAVGGAQVAELEAILDAVADGVVVVDKQGQILGLNSGAERLFALPAAELGKRSFVDLFAGESESTARDYLARLAGGSARLEPREIVGLTGRNARVPLLLTIGAIGTPAEKYCAVFRDISAWKKVEQELINARQQAEKASATKSEFLAKISHEIRTPLNAIIGFSEVMMDERFGPIGNERYREYLKDIHASGGHLLSLLNDLLDLSKIEAGKLDLSFESIDLNDVAQQAVAIIQPQASRERIIIRMSLPRALPPVNADARSVRQIILNLLSNSIKYTGAGGQVIVSTAVTDNGDVALRIRDTGTGMTEQELETALEPFRQLAAARSAGAEGAGLGLPLSKALAEANRARFNIKSAPNAGTLVEVVFPVARVMAAE
jgi:PAS domain S-box-containing protein